MPLDPVTLGIASSVVTGIFGGGAARRAKRAAQREAKRLSRKLANLERNRQAIIDPYRGIQDISGMATDRSAQMTNAYNNLSVATQAAEMKIEQADISLANTLDTLMQTGSGAGGATALAQAALQSKKEVAASIEQQEVANEKLRAQGEESLEQRRIAEQARIEGIQMSEAQRVQQARSQGEQFMFNQREQREMQQINRTAAQLDNARAAVAQAQRDGTSAITGAIGGIANALTKVPGQSNTNNNNNNNNPSGSV
jgi:chromosome segregation ATPase